MMRYNISEKWVDLGAYICYRMPLVYVITCIWVQLKNNCMNNSQVITRGESQVQFWLLPVELFFNCTEVRAISY